MEDCIGCHKKVTKDRDFCSKSCEERYTRIMEYVPDEEEE